MTPPTAFRLTARPDRAPAVMVPALLPMVELLITPVPGPVSVALSTPVEVIPVMLAALMLPPLAVIIPDRVPIVAADLLVAVTLPVPLPVTDNCCRRPGALTGKLPFRSPWTDIVAFWKLASVSVPEKVWAKLPANVLLSGPAPPSTVVAVAG